MSNLIHDPVLCDGVLRLLDIQATDVVVDGTVGFGGHASLMQKKLGKNGVLIGLDQDPAAIDHCRSHLPTSPPMLYLQQANFSDMKHALSGLGVEKVDKILLDLGMSSYQLDLSNRGFSYSRDEPLDMRMNPTQDLSAQTIIMTYDAQALSDIFYYFGELRHNKKLVDNILKMRETFEFKTTEDLCYVIKHSYFFNNNRKWMLRTFAQVFQALRIAVNRELEVLERFLQESISLLNPGGRVAIISFHSLEDKLIKRFVKAHKGQLALIEKKVIQADQAEIKRNSRAACAKLRGYEVVGNPFSLK